MKKRMLFCALFVMMLVTNIYALDPIVGNWTAMKNSCLIEITIKQDKTFNTWAACWDTDAECFQIGDVSGTWQKIEKGIYALGNGGIRDMLIVKGAVATTSDISTLLKGVPLKITKDTIYPNQCF